MTDSHAVGAASPFPETADIATSSDDYASRFAGATGTWFLDVQETITRDLLSTAEPGTVLDVGGGHGQLALPLCHRGYRVTVLSSHESCRKRIASIVDSRKCAFVVGNVVQLPFEDASFDAVISFRLLPHCDRWPQLISELCRVARTQVIVDYPAITGINALAPVLFAAKKKVEKNTREWRQFKHAEVCRTFEKNGFVLASRRGQFFLPMALHRALHCRTLSRFLEGTADLIGLRRRFGSPVVAAFDRRGIDMRN